MSDPVLLMVGIPENDICSLPHISEAPRNDSRFTGAGLAAADDQAGIEPEPDVPGALLITDR
jgi:hypothetical protein